MLEVNFEYAGITAFLMHQDDVEFADELDAARKAMKQKGGKATGKAGDDRSPAWSWIGSLYSDGKVVAIPHDVIMANLRGAAARVSTGKGNKTYKEVSQGALSLTSDYCQFLAAEKPVPMAAVAALRKVEDFEKHQEFAQKHNFSLFVKRAKIGQSKHVRVRPKFDPWTIRGSFMISDESALPLKVLQDICEIAGRMGLGDWRPSAIKSGPYGQFKSRVWLAN